TAAMRPLEVQVVALDWKWLFIYPEQGIATVNQLVLPVDRPVRFRITSSSVMNTFYVPAMAGMIYAMPGMETKLNAVLNKPGRFEGMSANYSGAGFSDMKFWTNAVDTAGFDRWVAQTKAQTGRLTSAQYLRLEKPSEKVPPMAWGGIEAKLFDRAVEMCVNPDQPCMGASVKHDMAEPGNNAPINDRPQRPGEAQGAILKQPSEKGSGDHLTAPKGNAPGARDTGNDANRNMTSLERPVLPGTPATARS
ncbi:MAG: cytochrome ubiquinol oxidase subunit II, partial [Alphaproteobacteria bacterium]